MAVVGAEALAVVRVPDANLLVLGDGENQIAVEIVSDDKRTPSRLAPPYRKGLLGKMAEGQCVCPTRGISLRRAKHTESG
jgi:hypothetical protein